MLLLGLVGAWLRVMEWFVATHCIFLFSVKFCYKNQWRINVIYAREANARIEHGNL